jgi:hypothetical protein
MPDERRHHLNGEPIAVRPRLLTEQARAHHRPALASILNSETYTLSQGTAIQWK